LIEISSTDMINLVNMSDRDALKGSGISEMLEKLYWKSGATELATGKKTLTLQQFEEKYMTSFYEAGLKFKNRNLRQIYLQHFADSDQKEIIIEKLKRYDSLANVLWRLAHLKSSAHYLSRNPDNLHATGGTNWQKYLPPRFQKIMFFPELWNDEEKAEWGKAAVINALSSKH
jgi:tryptophan 2,3-dioxygenase